jgi:gamma-glutamyltranspeptidase/glutathione hydrolase
MRALLFAALLVTVPSTPFAASFPAARAQRGMVTADSVLASEAGARMLAQGGDAADAAVATALVLGVVQNFASGIGGGGFAVVWRAKEKRAYALDFREVAPRAATRDMYLDEKGDVVKGASTRGPRAAGVPGELAGLWELHRRHGKLPWATVVQPALALARDGFPAHDLLVKRVQSHLGDLTSRPLLAAQFLRGARGVLRGETVKRTDLGRTLAIVAKEGAPAFYTGGLAKRLAAAIQKDGGLITGEDLAAYKVVERPVLRATYRGLEVLSMPPPSSGGIVLLQVLRVLEATDPKALGHNSSAWLHRLTEALKHAFADRAAVMGDPDFTPVPTEALLSDEAVARVRAAFRPDTTLPQGAYGGEYALPEDGGTSHFNVVDAEGNAIALTTTVNTGFGSMYVAGDTGVLMNNEMDDFVAKPGVPNAFGLVGRAANAIEPGKRPLSSMTPTLVLRDDKVLLAVGGSGGPTIITGTLQVLLNIVDFGMDARAAVEAPRIHHQWVPPVLAVEAPVAVDVVQALTRRGHAVTVTGRMNAVQALTVDDEGLAGACDPEKLGAPAGVP